MRKSGVDANTIRCVFNRIVVTIAVTLLATGIAFFAPAVALVLLGLYAALTILFGRLYTMLRMKMSFKPHRRV